MLYHSNQSVCSRCCSPVEELDAALKLDGKEFRSEYRFAKPSRTDLVVTHSDRGVRGKKAVEVFKNNGFANVQVRSSVLSARLLTDVEGGGGIYSLFLCFFFFLTPVQVFVGGFSEWKEKGEEVDNYSR